MKIPKAFGTPVQLTAFRHSNPVHTPAQALAASTKLHADGEVARWWLELSDAGREEYVAEHPTSKYADYHRSSKNIQKPGPAEPVPSKMGDSKSHEGGEHEPAPATKAPPQDPKHKAEQPKKYHPPKTTAPKPHPAHDFEPSDGKAKSEHKPEHSKDAKPDPKDPDLKSGSPARKKIGAFLKKHSSQVYSHVKKDVKEWKHAGHAISKLASGKGLDHEDKHAIGAVAADIAAISVSLMLTGGAAHGLVAFMSHFGKHLAQEALLKAAVKGAIHHASVLTSSTEQDEVVKRAIAYMMDQIENGDIQALMKKYEAAEAKEKSEKSEKKPTKAGAYVDISTNSTPVAAKLDMGEHGAGAGFCPETSCHKRMDIAMVGSSPSWVCAGCRVSLPLPDNHEYFQQQEQNKPLID